MDSSPPLIELRDITKIYRMGDVDVPALAGVSLSIRQGEFVAVMGSSGSGKSTLMNMIGCLDRPTSGSYRLDGKEISSLEANALAKLRNRSLGFVFQGFNLLARTSALENVEMPLIYAGEPKRRRTVRARQALERVGLSARMHHHPSQLSGGQQQRVAIARALVTEPRLILADEPTGNLDSRTSVEIMALFQELGHTGITVVLVTHEQDIAAFAARLVQMRDGKVISDKTQNPARAHVPPPGASPMEASA